MASSSNDNYDESLDEEINDIFQLELDNSLYSYGDPQQARKPRKKRVHIERHREEGHIQLWNDYFAENPTFPPNLFRRRFRMNKPLFMRVVDRLSAEIQFFQQRRDATGRYGFSALQKCTAAIRMLAYGLAVDEYLRIGATTSLKCMEHFVEGIIDCFGDEYLRKPNAEDLQQLLVIGEIRGFPGMMGSIDCTLNDLNILDRSPVFDDILKGRAPKVNYTVNGNDYHLGYYLTDGIYPKWATFIQSISLPQTEKASLFATHQEACRKDVERAFGVLQARFAIVKNPALSWDKVKIGNIMRACLILHNMIVEDERDGYTLYDTTEFEQAESAGSSRVDFTYSTDLPSNIVDMMATRSRIRDPNMHQQLKKDLVEHIWAKYSRN
ncbi:Harbinger transposase-derived protein [Arabidopsis thaliana x Arabidopsis arenosa]|uniref:Harbinger transposase-derived protein n=1 Tax=Arabidopsis thaliana x Arabidopsis arenosa TaxID=1240361 RepID=A0A8T2A4Z9_9BRAS|nr:Harbinger transposase-derived protein [Arabidopsis thaliana x Arabidopsis arenosa]